MLTRRQMLWIATFAVLGAAAGTSAWVLLDHPARAMGVGGPFTLIDGDGKTVTDSDLLGRWTLIYFGYTHCPDACPTALQDMADAVDALDPAQRNATTLVFITIDPARDTPAVMKDYVSNFHAPIVALTGSAEQVAAVSREYRVYYAKHPTDDGYDMDHSSVIYAMDSRGELVATFSHETSPAEITARLKRLITAPA